jgi:RNA polymerase sigma-70 factor, ECF subfamily
MTLTPEQLISTIEPRRVMPEARLVPFRAQVQRHLLAMVRDKALAEELTQDAYARAVERIDQLRDPQAALAWLYRIATTVALDRLRQRRSSTVPLDTVAAAGGEAEQAAERDRPPSLLEAALESAEMSACVQGYLAALPDDYRIAILLHDAHGLSNPEIAELLGCSLATAKIRVHRARVRLREMLAAACSFGIDERGVLVCEPQPEIQVRDSTLAGSSVVGDGERVRRRDLLRRADA